MSSEPSCSDHRHIRFDIDVGKRPIVEYRNVRSTDWAGYKSSLQANLLSCGKTKNNHDQLHYMADKVSEAIVTAYHENYPLKMKRDNRGTP